MQRRRKQVAAATTAVALAAVLTGVVAGGGGAQAAQQQLGHDAGTAKPLAKGDRVVTLITGDRVILDGGDEEKVRIERGAGRDKVVFRLQRTPGKLVVLPSDVSSAVTSGKLDRRLFDVTGLLELGYDDSKTKAIPLIVTYAGDRAARSGGLPGATTRQELPAVNGAAVSVPKEATGEFLQQLGQQARSASVIDQVWLDGKRKVTLDKSVPQIGAPKAWQAGFTGKGVKVAVLDTGIDSSHPDFKGQIAAAKNFTTGQAGDGFGHGTHVASIVAGTAAASAGKYKGVAPGAKLLDGKVCDDQGGCEESAILAGMEWAAVEQKAKVVNVSLGGQDTPEIDPVEAAVNRLTARTGALFVIAAGNSGPGEGSVDSPGSAEAALTVGSVDKQDKLAETSSRGPRVGDGAIKPDVTAPGVDIVAAKAKNSQIGRPVGTQYLQESGTSMATPHVAGAAALLLQEHPTWKAGELKSTLMGTAKALPGLNSFEQGAGRIDVGKAIVGSVVAEPGSLSFGKALWPHTDDKPVVKKLTYRNLGTKPVTLALKVTATAADGKPAPASAFKLSATSLTIAPGGTASVSVISDTRHQGPDTLYSGRVLATGGGQTVGTPLAVEKEIESYDVTVKHLLPNGQGTDANYTTITGIDEWSFTEVITDEQGNAKLRLPKGRYTVDGGLADEEFRVYQLVWPTVTVDKATTLAVDAKRAKPVRMTLPHQDATLNEVEIGYTRATAEWPAENATFARDLSQLYVGSVGAPAAAADMQTYIYSRWGKPNKDGQFVDSPYSYDLMQGVKGRYYDGYNRVVKANELATVTSQYAADQPGATVFDERFGLLADMGRSAASQAFLYHLPTKTVHYLDAGVRWATDVTQVKFAGDEIEDFPVSWFGDEVTFQRGKGYRERWGAAVASADLTGGTVRAGNEISVLMFVNTDQDGHAGTSLSTTGTYSTRLFRDGKLLASEEIPGQLYVENAPAGKAAYRLEVNQKVPAMQLATQVSGVWTFSSAATAKEEQLPLWGTQFRPAVDLNNSVARQPVSTLPFVVKPQPKAKVGALRKVEVQISGDGGKTWTQAIVVPKKGHNYAAVFKTPAGAKLISVKSVVTDKAGNTATQTVTNAYRIR